MTDGMRRANAAWLRAQLGDLLFALAVRALSNGEVRAALSSILDGRSWRAVPADTPNAT